MTNTQRAREFTLDLSRLGEQVPEIAADAQRAVALDVFESLVKKSPVDTGRFRGNWQLSTSVTPGTPVERVDGRARGSDPGTLFYAQEQAKIAQSRPYETIYAENGLPYAERLENGWSQQAPAGMVALTVAEFETRLEIEGRDFR